MKRYPYRFKTEKEFIKEYGNGWRNNLMDYRFVSGMDYLLGTEYPYDVDELDQLDVLYTLTICNSRFWYISWDMLTENKPTEPSYKPKTKIIRTL